MSGLMNGALPIGMVFFLATVTTFVVRRMRRHAALRDWPALAAEFGLRHQPSPHRGAQGRLRGTIGGRGVLVDPEDRRIFVNLEQPVPIELRSYAATGPAPAGRVTVFAGSALLRRHFKTRVAAPELASSLAASTRLDAALASFSALSARRVSALSVSESGVTCNVDFGTPPFIPASALRTLLPACLRLASAVESLGQARQTDSMPPGSEPTLAAGAEASHRQP